MLKLIASALLVLAPTFLSSLPLQHDINLLNVMEKESKNGNIELVEWIYESLELNAYLQETIYDRAYINWFDVGSIAGQCLVEAKNNWIENNEKIHAN